MNYRLIMNYVAVKKAELAEAEDEEDIARYETLLEALGSLRTQATCGSYNQHMNPTPKPTYKSQHCFLERG